MKTMSKMKTLLISVAAVAAIVSANTASASLARVDYEGVIDRYVDDSGLNTYNGIVGQNLTGAYLIETAGADLRDRSNFGVYKVTGADVATAQAGLFSFSSDLAVVKIFNDAVTLAGTLVDGYLGIGARLIGNEVISFGVSLVDTDADQFSSDGFVAEPVLSEFESNRFFIKGTDMTTMNRTFLITGSLTSLIDPPVAPVPLPAPLLLLGSALAALGFGARKKSSTTISA